MPEKTNFTLNIYNSISEFTCDRLNKCQSKILVTGSRQNANHNQRARSVLKTEIFTKNGLTMNLIFILVWLSHSCSFCAFSVFVSNINFFDCLPNFIPPMLSFAPPLILKWFYYPLEHNYIPSTQFLFLPTSSQILFCIQPLKDLCL